MLRGILVLSLLTLTPIFASAALLPSFGSPIEIGVNPEHPRAGNQVTLTVSDPQEEVGTTAYMWLVNEVVVDQGIGHKSIAITARAEGTTETVRVIAIENGIARGDAVTIIRPASVDIIWEGGTYTPPLYIGRPLPTAQSTVTVIAIPHLPVNGTEAESESLIYSWKMGGVTLQKQSGYGKSSITVTPPRFGAAFSVSVLVSNRNGTVVAENSVLIQPQTPSIIIYEDAPLIGVRFNKAETGLFPFINEEVSFVAYPLFVSNMNDVSYTWNLDTSPFAVDPARPRAATFRKVGGGKGTHTVSVSFENMKKFLERGDTTFQLTF